METIVVFEGERLDIGMFEEKEVQNIASGSEYIIDGELDEARGDNAQSHCHKWNKGVHEVRLWAWFGKVAVYIATKRK